MKVLPRIPFPPLAPAIGRLKRALGKLRLPKIPKWSGAPLDLPTIGLLLGIWGAIAALPVAIVGILGLPTSEKVTWTVIFAVDAAVATGLMRLLLKDRPTAAPRRSRRGPVIGLALAIPISVVLGSIAGHMFEDRVRESAVRACAVVGFGNDEYQQAFYEAYQRNGGAAALGCPLGPVLPLEGAYHQNLDGPKGRSVIMATEPDAAYVLTGAPYAAYLAIGNGDGVQSSVLAGFPYSDVVRLFDGGKVELGAGGRWARSGLAGKRNGPWYWVPDKLWAKYSGQLHGPDGCLGYPIEPSRPWENGIRQDFEHGSLSFRQDRGVVTTGGCVEADPPSAAPVTAHHALVYQVDADHGIPHEIPPTKSASQDFTPSLPFVDEIGIIAGVDPAKSTSPQHSITLQLLDRDQHILFHRSVTLNDNRLTTAGFPPIPVAVGKVYWLRVINDSADVIGVYLNDPARANHIASPSARALLDGELPNPRVHRDDNGALCGRIEGTSG